MHSAPTSPADSSGTPIGHHVGGQSVAGTSGRTASVFDPATGLVTGRVALADAREVARAVAAAQAAQPAWAEMPPLRRARVLFRFREALEAARDELARLVSAEHGKVLADAVGEVTRGIEIVEFACGIPQLLKGAHTDQVARGIDNWTLRQPLGVVAGVTPFNFPVMVPLWMAPLALATGNAFVLKPSPLAPSAPLRLAELLRDAGLPAAWQAGAGAGRRQEPSRRDAGRRSGSSRRRPDRRGLRLRRRALHGRVGRRARW